MKLSALKKALTQVDIVRFRLPDGTMVPAHFHVTEIGKINKHFIDCGGNVRNEEVINFQLWTADDYDHRLSASKLRDIIALSEEKLRIKESEIEVEYQGQTIQKFGLEYKNQEFLLISKQTDCLDKEKCGITTAKPMINLANLQMVNDCTPGSGCC